MNPFIISSLAIIVFSGFIHTSFQMSVSALTLLSGHSLGRKTAHKRVLRLMHSFIIGTVTLTTLLVLSLSYVFSSLISHSPELEQLLVAIISGLLAGLGIATWAFYYRKGDGTALWLPRNFARYLSTRARRTKSNVESFGLGMTSMVAELLFTVAPMAAASLAIVSLPGIWWQLSGILLYVIVSSASLSAVFTVVGSGHKISHLQAWREKNKRFLQFIAGGSLIILSCFIFIDRLLGISLYGGF